MNRGFNKTKTEICNFIEEDNIYNKSFNNISFVDNINSINFTDCIFDSCTFHIEIYNSTFTNCLFVNSDLSNTIIDECGLHYVSFINSKLVGLNLSNSILKNSILENNICMMLNFFHLDIKSCDFKNNNMISSRLYNIKLSKVSFIDNKMNGIEIIETSLKNIDLRSNDISDIVISVNDIKGCIIDVNQVFDFIKLLEVVIK